MARRQVLPDRRQNLLRDSETGCLRRLQRDGQSGQRRRRGGNLARFGPDPPLSGPSAPRKVTGLRVKVKKSQAIVRWRPAKAATSYWVRIKRSAGRAGNWVVVRRPVAQFSVEAGSYIAQVRASGSGGPGAIRKQRFVAR